MPNTGKGIDTREVKRVREGVSSRSGACGEVAERLKAPLSKSGILAQTGIVGSNPTLSATCRMTASKAYIKLRIRCGNGLHTAVNALDPIPCHGEMSELAEGARLEIVCTVKNGTEGSNPSLSASFFQDSGFPGFY
jgi:hypothetical protein